MNSDKKDSSVQDIPLGSSEEDILRVSRRRLLTTGLGASAFVATVASRPAWANGICTKSGLQSANLSGKRTFDGCGKSAGFWKQKQYAWPSEVSPNYSFTGIFGSINSKGSVLFSSMTLGEVISDTGANASNPSNIGLHLIGAYVNSFAFPKDSPSGKGFVYYPPQIISMFSTAVNNNTINNNTIETLKNTLESANDLYDHNTEWSH